MPARSLGPQSVRHPWQSLTAGSSRLALAAVVLLAFLTPAAVLLRLARDPGLDPPLANLGPERSILDPVPVPRLLAVVAPGATDGRVEQATPAFQPLSGLTLGVRLLNVPAGATVSLVGRDEARAARASCTTRQATTVAALIVTCPVDRPDAVRSVEVTVTGATAALGLEAREDRYGLTAGGLYAAPPPRDLAGRVGRALDRLGVLRPPVASPVVLLGVLAISLASFGAAVLFLLPALRRSPGPLREG